jgi:hypothetical protein
MTKSLFKIVCGMAWAALWISSATTASAKVASTTFSGTYATCGGAYYNSNGGYFCGIQFSYQQTIRIASAACNTGACEAAGSWPVEFMYPVGRKIVTSTTTCPASNPGWVVYEVGTCSC